MEKKQTKITYKAFNNDFTCKGFQYEIGKEYEEKNINICNKGFHSCEFPLSVLSYYDLFDSNLKETKFAKVEISGELQTEDDKICSEKIKILEEIDFKTLNNDAVNILINNLSLKDLVNSENKDKNYAQIGSSGYSAKIGSSGDSAQIGSSGNYAKIGSSGYYAQIGSSGDSAKIGSSGYSAKIGSSGDSAKIGSSGNYAKIGSSGNYAKIGSSGDSAKIGSSGYYAQIGSSGDSAKIGSSGEDSVISAIGIKSQIKAKKGSWITLAEYKYDNYKSRYIPVCVKSAQIDGKKLKEDTWYKLDNKKFIEVKNE